MKKNNNLQISLKYVTNFNPNFLIRPKNLNKNYNDSLGKVNCKNFILFVLLLKNIFKKNHINIFVKPKKSNLYNILRAPYKNKMSRHQITLSRFFFNISIKLPFTEYINFNQICSIVYFLDFLKNFYSFFESNICFQHKSNLSFKFYLNNFFFI